MKVHPMAAHCPLCAGPLEVAEARCPECEVVVRGRFALLEFNRLSPEQLEMLRLFIRSRGNLKELGRALGVSYPTARARFEDILTALGYAAETPGQAVRAERASVLDALEAGRITAAEASARLRRTDRR